MPSVGQQIIDAIIAGKLVRAECPDSRGSNCVLTWSANVYEQIDQIVMNYDQKMEAGNDSAFVQDAAVKIMSALLSNPSIIQSDAICGWRLSNCNPLTLGEYAWYVARELERSRTTDKPSETQAAAQPQE